VSSVSPPLRVSDEQRERAVRELREHYAAGRLSEEELSERVESVYGAQTEEQLRKLVADLPRLPATPAQQRAELAAHRAHLRRRLLQEAGGGIGVFLLCTVVWVVAGAHGQFWPIWVALVALIPLLRNGWRLYGPAPELDAVERELEARAGGADARVGRADARAARRAHRRRL
jgi:DUF1707 SHOCT-like domain